MSDGTSPEISVWIWFLRALSAVNIGVWIWTAQRVLARGSDDADVTAYRRRLLWLSALFVFGCAFRSILPRADVQRIALFAGWPSCVMLGRSVATVAEMAFMAQWALVLRAGTRAGRRDLGWLVGLTLVPLIGVAEICSWYAVLTTNYIGNVMEQSIWTISSTLVIAAVVLRGKQDGWPRFAQTAAALVIPYVLFMSFNDVPMYFRRWRVDQAEGRPYLSLAEGVRDASQRVVLTRQLDPWREEIAWMSLYFSSGVWVSLWLVRGSPAPVAAMSRSEEKRHSKFAS